MAISQPVEKKNLLISTHRHKNPISRPMTRKDKLRLRRSSAYKSLSESVAKSDDGKPAKGSPEWKQQMRAYYKTIRSKPKGKKPAKLGKLDPYMEIL